MVLYPTSFAYEIYSLEDKVDEGKGEKTYSSKKKYVIKEIRHDRGEQTFLYKNWDNIDNVCDLGIFLTKKHFVK